MGGESRVKQGMRSKHTPTTLRLSHTCVQCTTAMPAAGSESLAFVRESLGVAGSVLPSLEAQLLVSYSSGAFL